MKFKNVTTKTKWLGLSSRALGTAPVLDCISFDKSTYVESSYIWYSNHQILSGITIDKAKALDLTNNPTYTDSDGNKGNIILYFDDVDLDCKNIKFGRSAFDNYNRPQALQAPQKIVRNLTVTDQWTFFANHTIEEVYNMKVIGEIYGQFEGCQSIRIIKGLDLSQCNTSQQMFKTYGGINLEVFEVTGLKYSLDISNCFKLPREQLVKLFREGLVDTTESGLGTQTLTIGTTLMSKLTDEDKKIATDKGWTLA